MGEPTEYLQPLTHILVADTILLCIYSKPICLGCPPRHFGCSPHLLTTAANHGRDYLHLWLHPAGQCPTQTGFSPLSRPMSRDRIYFHRGWGFWRPAGWWHHLHHSFDWGSHCRRGSAPQLASPPVLNNSSTSLLLPCGGGTPVFGCIASQLCSALWVV